MLARLCFTTTFAVFFTSSVNAATVVDPEYAAQISESATLATSGRKKYLLSFPDGMEIWFANRSKANWNFSDDLINQITLESGVFRMVVPSGPPQSIVIGGCVVAASPGIHHLSVSAGSGHEFFSSDGAILVLGFGNETVVAEGGAQGYEAACEDGLVGLTPIQGTDFETLIGYIEDQLGDPDDLAAIEIRPPNEPQTQIGSANGSIVDEIIESNQVTRPVPQPTRQSNTASDLAWNRVLVNAFENSPLFIPVNSPGPASVFELNRFGVLSFVQNVEGSQDAPAFILPDPALGSVDFADDFLPYSAPFEPDFRPLRRSLLPLVNLRDDVGSRQYATFYYNGKRYAIAANYHDTTGQLGIDEEDRVEITTGNSFEISSGQVSRMEGFAGGLGVIEASGAYTELSSDDLIVAASKDTTTELRFDDAVVSATMLPIPTAPPGPESELFMRFGLGINAQMHLISEAGVTTQLHLFGSAIDPTSKDFDLATQDTAQGELYLFSQGNTDVASTVPTTVPKYNDDHLKWGVIAGKLKSNSGNQISLLPTGWVAGREWSPADLEDFTGAATYKGHTYGSAADATGLREVFGSYENTWDFANGTGDVSINFDGTNYLGKTFRTKDSIAFDGNINGGGRFLDLKGKFFGNSMPGVAPDALGGRFSIKGTTQSPYLADGIFAAEKE